MMTRQDLKKAFTRTILTALSAAVIVCSSPASHADLEQTFSTTGEGICSFNPLKGDRNIRGKAALLVCLPGIPHCNQFMKVYRAGKLIFEGPFRTARGGDNVFVVTGIPIGHYASPPNIILFPPTHSDSPSVPAILNYEAKNRQGVCTFGEGPFPLSLKRELEL